MSKFPLRDKLSDSGSLWMFLRYFSSLYDRWSFPSFAFPTVVISLKEAVFTVPVRRQMFLFADIMWAHRYSEERHLLWDDDAQVQGWFRASGLKQLMSEDLTFYLLFGWAQTQTEENTRSVCHAMLLCLSDSMCDDDAVHVKQDKYQQPAAGQRKSTCQTCSVCLSLPPAVENHQLKLSLFLLWCQLTVWEGTLMPPCVYSKSCISSVTANQVREGSTYYLTYYWTIYLSLLRVFNKLSFFKISKKGKCSSVCFIINS